MTETQAPGYQYVVTFIAKDRPGLLAALLTPLSAAGCAIETASVTPLDRVVGIILLVWVPSGAEPAVRSALVGLTVTEDVKVHVDPIPDGDAPDSVLVETHLIELFPAPDSSSAPIAEAARILGEHGVAIRAVWPGSNGLVNIHAVIPTDTDEAAIAEEIGRIGGQITHR